MEHLLKPELQYGAFAIAALCLLLVAWMIRKGSAMFRQVLEVVQQNTAAYTQNTAATQELRIGLAAQTREIDAFKEFMDRHCRRDTEKGVSQ